MIDDDEPEPVDKIESAIIIAIYAGSALVMCWVAWSLLSMFL